MRESDRRDWPNRLIRRARERSKRRGHPEPEITKEWVLKQPLVCPYTGTKLIPHSSDNQAGMQCPWSPSLDRVDPKIGYTEENTRLTSWFWNSYRGSTPIDVAEENLVEWLWTLIEEIEG